MGLNEMSIKGQHFRKNTDFKKYQDNKFWDTDSVAEEPKRELFPEIMQGFAELKAERLLTATKEPDKILKESKERKK